MNRHGILRLTTLFSPPMTPTVAYEQPTCQWHLGQAYISSLFPDSLVWNEAELLLPVLGAPSAVGFVGICRHSTPCSESRQPQVTYGTSDFAFHLTASTASATKKSLFWFIDLDTCYSPQDSLYRAPAGSCVSYISLLEPVFPIISFVFMYRSALHYTASRGSSFTITPW